MSRGAKRMLRNWTFLLFTFLVPALQVILFCVAIGQQPKGLHLAVVNQDAGIDTVPTIFGPLPLPAVNLGNQVRGMAWRRTCVGWADLCRICGGCVLVFVMGGCWIA